MSKSSKDSRKVGTIVYSNSIYRDYANLPGYVMDSEDQPKLGHEKPAHPRTLTDAEYNKRALEASRLLYSEVRGDNQVDYRPSKAVGDIAAARSEVLGSWWDPSSAPSLENQHKSEREESADRKVKNSLAKFEDDAEVIFDDLCDVLCSKQVDYGPDNINNAPGGAMNGILVRMSDKMERLKNLTYNSDGSEPNHESVEDSLLDIANYAVIALMVRRGVWPKSYAA